MDLLAGQSLVTKAGSKVLANHALKVGPGMSHPRLESFVFQGKTVIVFYFSAHWCPPCRQFTPVLARCASK
jgi:nucleoredoxin